MKLAINSPELSLRQRKLVSSEIGKEFRRWRRSKGEPSEEERRQIVAIGFSKARQKMPSIPAYNPIAFGEKLITDIIGGVGFGLGAGLVERHILKKAKKNPGATGAKIGEEALPGYLFFGNLYADSAKTRMILDAFKDAGVKYIAEGGNLLDVYVQKADWQNALSASQGVRKHLHREYGYGENPLTEHEKAVLRRKAEGWDDESRRTGLTELQHYARGRASEARDIAAWGGVRENPGGICVVCQRDFPGSWPWVAEGVCSTACAEKNPTGFAYTGEKYYRPARKSRVAGRIVTRRKRVRLTEPMKREGQRHMETHARYAPNPRPNSHLEGEPCDVCGGQLMYMGALGKLEWYRCRNCGMEVESEAPRNPYLMGRVSYGPEGPEDEEVIRHYPPGKPTRRGRRRVFDRGMQEMWRRHPDAREVEVSLREGPSFDSPQANPTLMTVLGANPKRRRNSRAQLNPGRGRKVTMTLEKFAAWVKRQGDPALWRAFVQKVKGYEKWTHGSKATKVTVEKMSVPGVKGVWITYGMGRSPEAVYTMPRGSKRKGAWYHPWEKMPHLKGDPQAGVIVTKLVRGNKLTDFLHG